MYLQKINLKNKYALVTGAGKGLGRACSIALAEAGATIMLFLAYKKKIILIAKYLVRGFSGMIILWKCLRKFCTHWLLKNVKLSLKMQKQT